MFNTLKYAKILEEVGFSRDQAETSIKILVEIMEDILELRHEMLQLESRMTIKMGGMMAASIAIITAVTKFMH